jgi:hypothetical protein
MWEHECVCLYKCHSKSVDTMAQEYGFCLADKLNFTPKKNTLIPNRGRGAIFDLVGSFGINIRGDPHCVPLSLEGLSKATTRKPHRIFSTWRTCESALTKYAHAIELTDFDGLQDRGACFSPRLTKNGSVHMWLEWRHTPSSPSSWGCCHDQLCWNLKYITALWISVCKIKVPTSGSRIDHQGSVIFSVLERKWEQELPTTCICHNEVELPGSYGCPMIGEAEASSYNAMSAC